MYNVRVIPLLWGNPFFALAKAMTGERALLSALTAGIVAASASAALAIEAGDYVCDAAHVAGVSGEGTLVPLDEAPRRFDVSVSHTRVHPDELRGRPVARQHRPENGPVKASARIAERLFARPMTGLRSEDGALFAQHGNVVAFQEDGAFLAYGPAPAGSGDAAVAVYAGRCEKR